MLLFFFFSAALLTDIIYFYLVLFLFVILIVFFYWLPLFFLVAVRLPGLSTGGTEYSFKIVPSHSTAGYPPSDPSSRVRSLRIQSQCKYLSEGAAREWCTVVDISITSPSFQTFKHISLLHYYKYTFFHLYNVK